MQLMPGQRRPIVDSVLKGTLAAVVIWFAAAFWAPAGAADIGVVLMPGKGGTSGPNSLLGPLSRVLEDAGMLVEAQEVPWSRSRYLDRDYEDSMAEIDQAVERLRAKGAKRIVVGGQSMGANAALGYGARREGLAGIAAIAPGHVVEEPARAKIFAGSLAKARAMMAAGKGDERAEFVDNDQGKNFPITVTARTYVSWFAPDGPAVFPTNAAALKPGTALLWLYGDKDVNLRQRGQAYAFAKAPPHPKSAYVVVAGGHTDTIRTETGRIKDWIASLD